MNKLKFVKGNYKKEYSKKDLLLYNFLSSVRQKMNDPLKKRKNKLSSNNSQ